MDVIGIALSVLAITVLLVFGVLVAALLWALKSANGIRVKIHHVHEAVQPPSTVSAVDQKAEDELKKFITEQANFATDVTTKVQRLFVDAPDSEDKE